MYGYSLERQSYCYFFYNQNNNVDFMTCRALARRLTYMFSRLKKGHIMTFCQKILFLNLQYERYSQ